MSQVPLVFCGRSTYKLAAEVVRILGIPLGDLKIEEFADGEPWYRVGKRPKIKGRKVFLIQSTSQYAPRNYYDLFGGMDAIRRQRPRWLTIVEPFSGFRRQEREVEFGEAIMAQLMARFIMIAGANEIVLCEPHAPALVDNFTIQPMLRELLSRFSATNDQIDSLFKTLSDVKVRVIDPDPLYLARLRRRRDLSKCVVLAPDKGRSLVAQKFAQALGIPLAQINKGRPEHDQVKMLGMIGNVRGKIVIIREDEIGTGGTIRATVREVMAAGATGVIVVATHAVLSGGAARRLRDMKEIIKIYLTDSIYLPWEKREGRRSNHAQKVNIISLAPKIARVITEINSRD